MKKLLSTRWLKSHNLILPADRKDELNASAQGEWELRIGNYIAEHLTREQIDEFEKFYDDSKKGKASDGDGIAWLERNYPDYQKVVWREARKLRREILAADDKVALINSWGQ